MSNCVHSESLVDVSRVIRAVCSSVKKNRCLKCPKSKDVDGLCFCLHCGSIFCSGPKSHLYNHIVKKPMHCLFVNTKNISIYCCICNNEISFGKTEGWAASELQGIIQNRFLAKNVKSEKKRLENKQFSLKYVSLVPGLENLGNTCYFNSVCMIWCECDFIFMSRLCRFWLLAICFTMWCLLRHFQPQSSLESTQKDP